MIAEQPTKPYERKWTPEQQQAIAHAMLDAKPKLTAAQASAAALAGTLPGAGATLEPFGPVPQSTCYHIARKERAGREVQARGRLAKAGTSANACAIVLADAWSELDRAREDVRRKKMSGAERAKALRELVTTAQTITRAERELTGEKPSKQAPSTTDPEPPRRRERSAADDLAREARRRATTEQARTPDTQHGDQAATAPRTDGSTDHATDSVAHAQAIDTRELAHTLD